MVVMLLLSIKSSCIETKLNDIYRLELAEFMHKLLPPCVAQNPCALL